MAEELERLKEDLKGHFDNEMELLRRVAELDLSKEQSEELVHAILEHPHAETARVLLSNPRAFDVLTKMFIEDSSRSEAHEEEST